MQSENMVIDNNDWSNAWFTGYDWLLEDQKYFVVSLKMRSIITMLVNTEEHMWCITAGEQ